MDFPKDFLWGAATAAFQVEGHPEADGAGVSNWLAFCRQPGRIANDDVPDAAPDQFHRYKEDVRIMRDLGVKAYRMSLSWSRIFPEGDGKPNPKGFDYYDRLVNELLENGIQPWITFFHWDLPQSLEERFGGWRSKEVCKRFGDYVNFASAHLSDRVTNFFTVNEITCFTSAGYGDGGFAPGLRLDKKTVNQTVYNGCLAHGYAMTAARAGAKQTINIGIVDNCTACVPVFSSPENVDAARTAFRLENSDRLTLIREGRFTPEFVAKTGPDMPEYTDDELKMIATPMDFQGINLYAPTYVMADPGNERAYRIVPFCDSHPTMSMPWLKLDPQIVYYATRFISELWPTSAIYVTENGCASADKPALDGEIYDTDRTMYLREHFRSAARAVRENYPLKGYFVWSLLDNFEWACGFGKRFGLVYVNYHDLSRTPKLSAKYYREVIKSNCVL